jgi:predicted PurR-regulated permease PerM
MDVGGCAEGEGKDLVVYSVRKRVYNQFSTKPMKETIEYDISRDLFPERGTTMNKPASEQSPMSTSFNSLESILHPWLTLVSLVRIALGLVIALSIAAILILLWQVVAYFSSLLLLFFSAWLITLLLTPFIRQLRRWRIPKPIAIVLTFLLLIAFVTGFSLLIVPGLIVQTTALASNLGPVFTRLTEQITALFAQGGITINLEQFTSQLQNLSQNVLQALLGVITAIPNFLFGLVLLIIITVLLVTSKDYEEMPSSSETSEETPSARTFFPRRWLNGLTFIRTNFETSFGLFFRGQIVIALIFGLITGVILWSTGFSYAATTGCICGLLMIIPFLGGPLSFIPLVIVICSSNRPLPLIIIDLVIFYVVQTLLLNVILPRLVGKSSGLGPISTLFVLLVGAQIGGLFGTLIAVPLVGTLNAVIRRLMLQIIAAPTSSVTSPVEAAHDPS